MNRLNSRVLGSAPITPADAAPRPSGARPRSRRRALHRLRFIRRCRDQVRDLLRLSLQKDQPCAEVNRISAEHLAEIEHTIADLARLADELRRINGRCQGGGLIADSRIVEALSP
jgi:DNA-binding transcriptional MerR regulator